MKKRTGLLPGVLVAGLVLWSALEDDSAARAPAVSGGVAEPISPSGIDPEVRQVPAPSPEPLRTATAPIAAENQDTASCDEMSRLTETTGLRVAFAPGVTVDEAACARAVRFATGATIPALPGLSGFEIPDVSDTSPARRLAAEPDDPDWARGMEGQILGALTELIDFPLNTVHAVCRTSTCGLVFGYRSADHSAGNYNFYAQRLADELGFRGYHGGVTMPPSGIWFMTIYLGDWQTRRPDAGDPARTAPGSFEEAFEALQRARESE